MMNKLESFDGKRIAFIGNSFTFFGKCVNPSNFDKEDDGYFYRLSRSFGDDVAVTNFTWGGASLLHKGDSFADRALYEKLKELHPAYYNNPQGLPLDDFYRQDAVVLQQSGDRIEQTYEDARLIMELFAPGARFGFYITTYDVFHNFEPSFEAARRIKEEGGVYIPLGHLVDDIINGRCKDSLCAAYDKNSFVVCREHDKFHPNTLTGYLTALCVYYSFSGRDLSNADHSFVEPMNTDEFYTLGQTNHSDIISDENEMRLLALQVEAYCKKYNEVQ